MKELRNHKILLDNLQIIKAFYLLQVQANTQYFGTDKNFAEGYIRD